MDEGGAIGIVGGPAAQASFGDSWVRVGKAWDEREEEEDDGGEATNWVCRIHGINWVSQFSFPKQNYSFGFSWILVGRGLDQGRRRIKKWRDMN